MSYTECVCGFSCGSEAAYEKHLNGSKDDGLRHFVLHRGNSAFTLSSELKNAVEKALDEKKVYYRSLEHAQKLRRSLAAKSGSDELNEQLQTYFTELSNDVESRLRRELKELRHDNRRLQQETLDLSRALARMERGMASSVFKASEGHAADTTEEPSDQLRKPKPGHVLITMIGATGLKNLNYTGDEIWCQCDVSRADRHAPASTCRTGTQRSLMPTWNETHEIPWLEGEPITFSIYDKGLLGSKKEGKVTVPSSTFYPHGFYEEELSIEDIPGATLKVAIVPFVFLDLKLKVIGAKKLRNADVIGKSDPYVVCNILESNGKKRNAFTTKVVKNCLDPVWNHAELLRNIEPGEALEFTVWDKDFPKADNLLGMVLMHQAKFNVRGGFRGDLKLADPEVADSKSLLVVEVVPASDRTNETDGDLRGKQASENHRVNRDLELHANHRDLELHANHRDLELHANRASSKHDEEHKLHTVAEPTAAQPTAAQPSPGNILVTMVSATGLKHLNHSGDEIWCQCEVTRADKHAAVSRCRTVGINSLMPNWNETHEIPWAEGEPLTFTIYDKGLLANKQEGKVVLPSSSFYPGGVYNEDLSIPSIPGGTLKVCVNPFLYLNLKVTVASARCLRNADLAGKSDPYVVVHITGKKGKRIGLTTKVVKNNLDPIWNHIETLRNIEPGESLEFTVWDKDLSADDILGMVSLSPEQYNLRGGFRGDLKLADPELANSEATLAVEVVPITAGAAEELHDGSDADHAAKLRKFMGHSDDFSA